MGAEMNWEGAVGLMRKGARVHRTSQQARRLLYYVGETPVYSYGRGAIALMAAWSLDDRPVQVFIYADARVAYMPEDEDMQAQDWAEAT